MILRIYFQEEIKLFSSTRLRFDQGLEANCKLCDERLNLSKTQVSFGLSHQLTIN